MKPKLILISHGQFALELKKSAEMIMGEIDGLFAIAMLESDGLEGTTAKLQSVFEKIGTETPVVIAADMMSGTPCNVAVHSMYTYENVHVITGLNLPMAIEYSVSEIEDADKMASLLHEVGKEAVKIVEKPKPTDGEEGYED